ncbi:hypothetical protein EDD22DRAFT_852543 [Suillus occidentalis]|nr:hypothetical protein EDD22DRAFT_852543 [Suillus occidentalis]
MSWHLAIALKTRYDKLDVSDDVNAAIDLHRESLRITRLDDPQHHITLHNLSSVLCSRFTDTRKNEDVEEAIDLCQKKTLEMVPSLHPDRHPTQSFPQRIIQAYYWTIAAEQHGHGSALEAYSTFFELLDAHLATRLSATSRREDATAFHYARTLPGRGQQWSLASRLKTPVEDLESANPTLQLSGAEQSSAITTDKASADRAATEYRRLTKRWEAAVVEIRNIQGFSQFLLPPAYENLQAAARHGPVIILIASGYSCDAIIVTTSGEPHHERFTGAIRHSSRMNSTEPRNDLIVLLQIVWNEIMLPVVDVLENILNVKRQSRICITKTVTTGDIRFFHTIVCYGSIHACVIRDRHIIVQPHNDIRVTRLQ